MRPACRRCQCESDTLVVNHHLRGSPDSVQGGGRTFCWACRRCQCETKTLAVDPRHWGSPDSIRLGSFNERYDPFVGRGHAPAANVRFPRQFPGLRTPKPFPRGEGGSPSGETDEERRNVPKQMHLPSSPAPKPSPSGEGGPAKPGRMRGRSVKATTSGEKPTFPPLISQKSKIFARPSPSRLAP